MRALAGPFARYPLALWLVGYPQDLDVKELYNNQLTVKVRIKLCLHVEIWRSVRLIGQSFAPDRPIAFAPNRPRGLRLIGQQVSHIHKRSGNGGVDSAQAAGKGRKAAETGG